MSLPKTLTAEALRAALHYCPETGRWQHAPGRKGAGKRLSPGCVLSSGYVQISVAGVRYPAHRLAWLYVYGRWPVELIDHINGIRADNRIANLREATAAENLQNRRAVSRNKKTKAPLGVTFDSQRNKWCAYIKASGKARSLGRYATIEEASAAYQRAKAELHPFYVPETR